MSENVFDAKGWWDPQGKHRLLHVFNPTRTGYVERVCEGLAGKEVLDAGCGGGIFAEALARSGAKVTGIDASAGAIEAAREHAKAEGLDISYEEAGIEDYQREKKFDAVVCMEMLEHVAAPAQAVAALAGLLKPGGDLVTGTINRTPFAYLVMIVGLEQVTGLIPRGTHEYKAFLKPDEIASWCADAGLRVKDVAGANWDFFAKDFRLSATRMPMNYFLHARKEEK
ncbi:MAG: bifunctional 2-polyprenyl-6-hydroxyphenol methylase/3-demethylubiquinol 3-O-methyltransferase UbiG [Betaproteobacteria bacterium AqS2]|uniref:Bifunctional 2-polyprenyl-6-hydroxyphenol methylase/3-demethylubiquinol 3-O-methyltransferase UbiG n=1 Tax=Candidatus Amphirhobacter heronislandensis TaxID=1732024 RepID=A0A930UBD2_9GAMM|nr:bifunctional 2-polyprenyl-6-hydroxyphenol methylase/3-demethylubiquinol 3-O-methyltransferase UbiG [Betaproteobacteria bacterium AqS2]